jgi:hypothetical protein
MSNHPGTNSETTTPNENVIQDQALCQAIVDDAMDEHRFGANCCTVTVVLCRDLNFQYGNGTFLTYASYHGHTKVVIELLKCNTVDVNFHGTYYGSALVAASANGHTAVVIGIVETPQGECKNYK